MGGWDPATNTFADFHTPPLQESDVWTTAWGMHVTFAFTNYAGFLFDLQYDGHELSQIGIFPAGPHVGVEVPGVPGLFEGWTFPGSQSSPQVVSPIAVWVDPGLAQQSGITVNASSLITLFHMTFHAKNTTPANNSDIDITSSPWQILHIVASGTFHLSESMWLYMSPGGDEFAPTPGGGVWVHHQGTTTNLFIPQSAFVATNNFIVNTGGIGIDHIPAPGALAMVVAGLGLGAVAHRRRRA
jgi:hypothetical protein